MKVSGDVDVTAICVHTYPVSGFPTKDKYMNRNKTLNDNHCHNNIMEKLVNTYMIFLWTVYLSLRNNLKTPPKYLMYDI